jgi:hypothetical protein
VRYRFIPWLTLSTLLLVLPASDAVAFDFDVVVPERFRYAQSHEHYLRSHERKPPSFSFERNASRSVEAPTRYRVKSILKYSRPLGDTGMILRVKLPLKMRKLVKFELRF